MILADPVVDSLLHEFEQTVEELLAAPQAAPEVRREIIVRLCELSRDTRFQIGPREFVNVEQVQRVANCLEESVDRIEQEGIVPEGTEVFCQNIRDRAARCRAVIESDD